MWSLLSLIRLILQIYSWIIIAAAVMSWLVAFGVLNVRNQFIRMVVDVLYRLTEPVLRPIRRMLPNLGGVDISPVVVLLIIFLLDHLIVEYGFGFGR
ncbi:MAG: YggT family protein [Reyranella sp.]|jgi:YggT family protein